MFVISVFLSHVGTKREQIVGTLSMTRLQDKIVARIPGVTVQNTAVSATAFALHFRDDFSSARACG